MFVHLGMNTVTGAEWGTGTEDPRDFEVPDLDARAWARLARESGFGTMLLTAKHHDGFCLWPSATTGHTIAASPWRDGRGDVVAEAARACEAEGVRFGLYCSPWDRNAPSYGSGRAYDDLFIAQLTELLTGYGEIAQVWFDGAVGVNEQGRQTYDWERIFGTVRDLAPEAVVFSDAGPDVRWVGNEDGVAASTSWSTVDPARVPVPGLSEPWIIDALRHGDPDGSLWRPAETDVSIRPGWFWRASESSRVRDAENLLELYLTSVGRNSKLLLNVPPTDRGVIDPADEAALRAFARRRHEIFGTDLAAGSAVEHRADGTTAEVVLTLPAAAEAELIALGEDIEHGQHIAAHRVQVETPTGWRTLAAGTTVGHRRIVRIPPTAIRKLRVLIDFAYGPARLLEVALHRDPGATAPLIRGDVHG